ncbi:MAG: NADH-quinone oxidoreductase subunit C [Elusimicrobiota bacterium]
MEEGIKKGLEERFGAAVSNVVIPRPRRMFADVPREKLLEVLSHIKDKMGFTHLSTITGLDAGDHLEALYHTASKTVSLSVRVKLPTEDPKIPSVLSVYPGAEFYEKELEDLVGVVVDGLPQGRRYPLSEDWPKDEHPLRKSWVKAG